MKINCEVCNKDEASVFCPADDAALCAACDHRVHHANNLAGKHTRFPLLPPSPKDSPICDICQEEKALLFCQQDRAILCKGCDGAIHKVNEHTMNHCRFLLTGVKLSPVALTPVTGNGDDPKPKSRDQKPVTIKKHVAVSAPVVNQTQKITTFGAPKSNGSGHVSTTSSSISEYLIETLPGWHVEDFLDSPPTFSKFEEDNPALFWDEDVIKGSMNNCFSPETMAIWVPQAPPPTQPLLLNPYHLQSFSNMSFGTQISPFYAPNNLNKITKSNEKREFEDGNCFAVPQITPPMMNTFKRSRVIR